MIISISGEPGSGKDTVGNIIQVLEHFSRLRLDYVIYDVMLIISSTVSYKAPHYDFKIKKFATKLKEDGLGQDVWVNALLKNYDDSQNWIITDARFSNELKAIKKLGGITVKVERNKHVSDVKHSSEKEWCTWDYDYTINNHGTLEDLVCAVYNTIYGVPPNNIKFKNK